MFLTSCSCRYMYYNVHVNPVLSSHALVSGLISLQQLMETSQSQLHHLHKYHQENPNFLLQLHQSKLLYPAL